MSIEPIKNIFAPPTVKKEENSLPKKRPRPLKKEEKKESGKIDIRV